MARKLALLPPLGKKAGNFLWIAYSRIVAKRREGGRDKFRVQLLRFNRCCGVRCNRAP